MGAGGYVSLGASIGNNTFGGGNPAISNGYGVASQKLDFNEVK